MSHKIDFTTFTRKFEWFSRDNTGASQTITSPRGNTYTIKTINGGSGFKILSGGNKILAFRAIVNVQMSTTDMTGAYGVQGIALDSTVYTRGYGRLNNGAASTMNETATTATGIATEAYTSIGDNAGAKYSTQIEQTGVRVHSSYWRIFGKIASTGCASTLSFDCEYTAQSNSVFGSVYQRGANVNTTTAGSGFIWVEFIESD